MTLVLGKCARVCAHTSRNQGKQELRVQRSLCWNDLMPHFYCCAALIPCMTGPWLGCRTCPLKTSCLCSCHAEITVIHVEWFLQLCFSWKWDELMNISWGESEMSRHYKVVKRPSSATFSKELITAERIQWLFTHRGLFSRLLSEVRGRGVPYCSSGKNMSACEDNQRMCNDRIWW